MQPKAHACTEIFATVFLFSFRISSTSSRFSVLFESLDVEFKRCTRFRSLNSGGERALERPDSYETILLTEGALMDEMIGTVLDFQSCLRVCT